MTLAPSALARPNRLEKTAQAEVDNLRRGLAALGGEPHLIGEVALCLAYLSLGEHGRAGLAMDLVEEFRADLNEAAQHLSPTRRTALESLLWRIESISRIQDTRNSLSSAMMRHTTLERMEPVMVAAAA